MAQKEGRSVPLWSRAGKFHHSVSLAHFWWRMSLFCEKLMLFERKEKRFPFPTQGLSQRVCLIQDMCQFHVLKQEQRCFLSFETRLAI